MHYTNRWIYHKDILLPAWEKRCKRFPDQGEQMTYSHMYLSIVHEYQQSNKLSTRSQPTQLYQAKAACLFIDRTGNLRDWSGQFQVLLHRPIVKPRAKNRKVFRVQLEKQYSLQIILHSIDTVSLTLYLHSSLFLFPCTSPPIIMKNVSLPSSDF